MCFMKRFKNRVLTLDMVSKKTSSVALLLVFRLQFLQTAKYQLEQANIFLKISIAVMMNEYPPHFGS